MSKKSKNRHRQQHLKNHAPRAKHPVDRGRSSPGATPRRALGLAGAVVLIAAVLYAISGSGGRKGETAALPNTNPPPSSPPAPAPALLSATTEVAAVAGGSGPKMVFATPVYDFGQIKGGESVKYTYVFTNVGNAVLQVSNVQASCGCTTAGEWTRQVEPGQTGTIPIQFNSQNFSGAVGKSITVTCNDTNQPSVVLQIKGTIWRPIDVTPQFAVLNVSSETPSNATTVRIVNNEEAPLTLSAPQSSNPAFATELITLQPGKEFRLIIKAVPPLPAGSVQGPITLKTSSSNLPLITITAWANLQPAVVVVPTQITLPAAPLASPTPATVAIRNNGTNLLTLTEPAVNAPGVTVALQEYQPGRYYTLTVNFPAGFELAPGAPVELSVKSSHPQFPIIKVPVSQPPRPAPPVLPPGAPAAPASPKP